MWFFMLLIQCSNWSSPDIFSDNMICLHFLQRWWLEEPVFARWRRLLCDSSPLPVLTPTAIAGQTKWSTFRRTTQPTINQFKSEIPISYFLLRSCQFSIFAHPYGIPSIMAIRIIMVTRTINFMPTFWFFLILPKVCSLSLFTPWSLILSGPAPPWAPPRPQLPHNTN